MSFSVSVFRFGMASLALLGAAVSAQNTGAEAATELRFREFFRMPVGRTGLEPSDTLRELHGRKVQITGYMVTQAEAPSGRFFLTPFPLRMSEHADGDADDLPVNTVTVVMPEAQRLRPLTHTPGLLQLTGRLQWGRHVLDDGRVVWLRLLLDPQTPSSFL